MRKHPWLIGGVLGGVTALVLAAFGELIRLLLGLSGVVFILFDWLTRHLPGELLTFFIGSMVTTIDRLKLGQTSAVAKFIEQMTAFLFFILVGIIFGIVLGAAGRTAGRRLPMFGGVGGALLWVGLMALQVTAGAGTGIAPVTNVWQLILLVGWGWLLGRLILSLAWPESAPTSAERRQFLTLVGVGSFAVLVSAAGVALLKQSKPVPNTGSAPGGTGSAPPDAAKLANAATTSGPAQSPPEAVLAARPALVPGTRPELTPAKSFYRVDINLSPPTVDAASWKLVVDGLVEHPFQFTLDQIRAMPSISQAITQECISNEVGGDLISTGIYTGVRLKDILAKAVLRQGVQELSVKAADGYYESVPVAEAMDERTLLVYALDGQPLPPEHGFPLRLYIPNHFGMKLPKWITSLTAVDQVEYGYWVERGWDKAAIPPTTSVIDQVAVDAFDSRTGLLPVGGIAFAGGRGISKVEVQIDHGPWQTAQLITPPLSPLTWVAWRYDWKAQAGQHTFNVRAYDGTGALQTSDQAPPAPTGATGIDSLSQFVTLNNKKQ